MTVKNVRSILQTNHTKGFRSEPSHFSPLTLRPLMASRSSRDKALKRNCSLDFTPKWPEFYDHTVHLA